MTSQAKAGGDPLEVLDLSVRLGGRTILDRITLQVAAGSLTAVLGPSGSGKSTLLRAIAGLEPVASGSIRLGMRELVGVPTHRRGIALMFQDGQLFDHLDVAANVGYALRLQRKPAAVVRARVGELLELVGLPGFERRRPSSLSGGEQQRVALARALAAEPRLLLLDEPLSALDAALRVRLATELRSILDAAGVTGVVVTHDHEEAWALADQAVLLRSGRVVQSGGPVEVWRNPVDRWAAEFLGYPLILSGAAADAVRRALPGAGLTGTAIAARRGAFRVSASSATGGDGSGGDPVVVRALHPEPEVLVVEVDHPVLGRVRGIAEAWGEDLRPGGPAVLNFRSELLAGIGSDAEVGAKTA